MKKVFSLLFVFALILATNALATTYSVTLKPNSDGLSQWLYWGETAAYLRVNDDPSEWDPQHPGDYIYSNSTDPIESFGVQDISSNPESINSVTVNAIAGPEWYPDVNNVKLKLVLITHGTVYYSPEYNIPTGYPGSFISPSYTWTVNPYTGNAWTKAEINNMHIGVKGINTHQRAPWQFNPNFIHYIPSDINVYVQWADVSMTT